MKRIVAIILTFVMVFSLGLGYITNASAAETYDSEQDDIAEDIFGTEDTEIQYSYDFEDGNTTVLVPNALIDLSASTFKTVTNPLQDKVNSSDTVLNIMPKVTSGNSRNSGIYLVSRNVLAGEESLYSVNFDMYMHYNGETAANYIYPTFVYDYKAADNWRGIMFQVQTDGQIVAKVVGQTPDSTNSWTTSGITFLNSSFNNEYMHDINDLENNSTSLKEHSWMSITAEYSEVSVKITVLTENGIRRMLKYELALIEDAQTLCGFTSGSADIYVDNLDINTVDGEDSTAADNYRLKHSDIFKLRVPTIAIEDEERIIAAINDYNALTDVQKRYLAYYDDWLLALAERMDAIKDDKSYSIADRIVGANYWDTHDEFTWIDNFDSQASLASYIDVDDYLESYGTAPQVVASDKFGSNALMLNTSTIVIKPELLPEKAKVKSVEYDYYVKDALDSYGHYREIRIYLYYYDADNYAYIDFQGYPGDTQPIRYRGYRYINGSRSQLVMSTHKLDLYEPLHIQYIFVSNMVDILITQNGESILELSYKNMDIRGQFAMGGIYHTHLQMYDNLKIVYEQGVWDVDEEVEEFKIYFSGNTYQAPGDVVMLTGSELGELIKGVDVMPIENTSVGVTDRKYFDYVGFDSSGVIPGTYSTDPSDYAWDSAKAIRTEILQLTDESVKFVLPTEYDDGTPVENGIFAIKLWGQDSKTNYIEKIIYINNPHIDFVVGNDGGHASPGGYFEITGKNISFPKSDSDYSNVKAILTNGQGTVVSELPIEEIFSDYNMRVTVPENVSAGEYELWVYNGYGDDYGWGIPFKVAVGSDKKQEILSQTMVNVLDNIYTGTKIEGTQSQNATYYVQQLLDILYQQGGGVLYFPKGIYRFSQPLVIPENVAICGESLESTNFIWTSFNWEYKKLPTYLMAGTGNLVIQDISIYCHRTAGVISLLGEKNENVYLSDIRTYLQNRSGSMTHGGHSGAWYTTAELILLSNTDTSGWAISTPDYGCLKNFQMKDCELLKYTGTQEGNMEGVRLTYNNTASEYVQIYDSIISCGWSPGQADSTVVRNVDFSNACFAITGHGVLYNDTYVHDNTINNRELFVADLAPSHSQIYMYGAEDDTTGLVYRFESTKNINVDRMVNMQIYVMEGQGNGQTRMIESCRKVSDGLYEITIENPFQLAPNRNSWCVIRWPRENMYFVENSYYNGSTVGFYGGVADAIFDGNTYQRVGNQYLWPCWGDCDWYVTYNRDVTIYDPFYITSDGTETTSGFTVIELYGSTTMKRLRGVVMRNCDFDGRYVRINTTSNNAVTDIVLDKNKFSKSEYAVYHSTTTGVNGIDGLLLYGNSYTEVDTPYSEQNGQIIQVSKAKNSVYDYRAVLMDDVDLDYQRGDVNLSGGVPTLKDCTMLRMYLVGMVELNEKQLELADMNQDGVVDLKDCTEIRLWILENS